MSKTIKLTYLGDIMLDYSMSQKYKINDNSSAEDLELYFKNMFKNMTTFLDNSDYVLANLETPIAMDNRNLTNYIWSFNSPIEFAKAIKNSGVDFVSTANNHCLDRGISGLESTINSLDKIGLSHCGTQLTNKNSYTIKNINGMKIGIIAYTYGTNAFSNNNYLKFKYRKYVNLLQEQENFIQKVWNKIFRGHFNKLCNKIDACFFPENEKMQVYEKRQIDLFRKINIKSDIKKVLKESPDLLIAYLHIGGQYNNVPSKYTQETADWFIRKNCDIVICNHEHVIHGLKIEGDKTIAYALGDVSRIKEKDIDDNHSIALHTYYNTEIKKIEKTTFSVLKTIINEDGLYQVWPVYDLLKHTEPTEQENIIQSALHAAEKFSSIKYSKIDAEFII